MYPSWMEKRSGFGLKSAQCETQPELCFERQELHRLELGWALILSQHRRRAPWKTAVPKLILSFSRAQPGPERAGCLCHSCASSIWCLAPWPCWTAAQAKQDSAPGPALANPTATRPLGCTPLSTHGPEASQLSSWGWKGPLGPLHLINKGTCTKEIWVLFFYVPKIKSWQRQISRQDLLAPEVLIILPLCYITELWSEKYVPLL